MSGEKCASAGARQHFDLRLSSLRGRRPVRADPRLGTDEKRIRAQSRISYKGKPQTFVVFIHNRVFGTDALYIRTKSTVGARERATALIARRDS